MPSYSPATTEPVNLKNLEEQFFKDIFDKEKRDQVYAELHSFFVVAENHQIEKYKNTYWKWYVFASWLLLNKLDFDTVVDCFEKQVPMAMSLDVDVLDQLMRYFMTHSFFDAEVMKMYTKVKKTFFESKFAVGKLEDKPISVADIVGEIKRLSSQKDESLQMAELRVEIKQLLFPDGKRPSDYVYTDPEEASGRFIDLIHFFLGVEEEYILDLLDVYINPDAYTESPGAPKEAPATTATAPNPPALPDREAVENLAKKASSQIKVEEKPAIEKEEVSVEPEVESEKIEEEQPIPEAPAEEEVEAPSEETEKKMSYAEIKEMIESRFQPGPGGEIENVEGVLMLLDNLAREYNDEKILDLYYFDENTGGFKWNEELLK